VNPGELGVELPLLLPLLLFLKALFGFGVAGFQGELGVKSPPFGVLVGDILE